MHQLHLLPKVFHVRVSIIFQIDRGVLVTEVWRQEVFSPSSYHGRGVVVRTMRHRIKGEHDKWDFRNPTLGILAFRLDSAHNVRYGTVTPFVNGIPLGVVRGGKYPLYSVHLQQLLPYESGKFPASIGKQALGSAKIRKDILDQSTTHGSSSVIFRWNQDSISREIVNKYDQVFHTMIPG